MLNPRRPILGSDELKAILDEEDRLLGIDLKDEIGKGQKSKYYCGPEDVHVTAETDFNHERLADDLQQRFTNLPREAILAVIRGVILLIHMR